MNDSEKKTMELYKICVGEEQFFLVEHHKRIVFYTGLLSAILTLTIGGLFKATTWYYFSILFFVGGILLTAVSTIAKAGTRRFYQRFLETVTTRAKIEYDLKISENRGKGEAGWAKTEQYIPTRHLRSRDDQKWKTSEEWVIAHLRMRKNYHGVTNAMFWVVFFIGIILIIISILCTYMNRNCI